jgi:hypothetical protein
MVQAGVTSVRICMEPLLLGSSIRELPGTLMAHLRRLMLTNSVTSAAIICIMTDTFWGPPMVSGVTLNLNIDYFHPAPVYVAHIHSSCISLGKGSLCQRYENQGRCDDSENHYHARQHFLRSECADATLP